MAPKRRGAKAEPHWTKVHDWIVEEGCGLKPLPRLILVYLRRRMNLSGKCCPSHARIARDLGSSRRTVQGKLAELERKGFVKVTRRKKPNGAPDVSFYEVADSPPPSVPELDTSCKSSSCANAAPPPGEICTTPPPGGSAKSAPPPPSFQEKLKAGDDGAVLEEIGAEGWAEGTDGAAPGGPPADLQKRARKTRRDARKRKRGREAAAG